MWPTIETHPHDFDIILYHADCPDGMGAAFSAWKALGDKATYVPCTHGENLKVDITGKHVGVFDFSFTKDVLHSLKSKAASIIIVDHHKSAMIELEGEPDCYFEMNNSGAVLAWKFFHPKKPLPKVIELIEDRDIWLWKIPFSAEFHAAFDMRPLTFETYSELLSEERIDQYIEEGKLLLKYKKALIEMILKKAEMKRWEDKNVYVVNSILFASDLGNILSSKEECDFALIWFVESGKCKISLRSCDKADVSIIAKKYGGGGHKNASGFVWKSTDIETLFSNI